MTENEKTRQEFTLDVERLDDEGRGVAHREGKVVFIEGALPGETVVCERVRNKPNFEVARLVSIQRESSLRVDPKCPYFGLDRGCCGGCAMQHLEPRAQVAFKQAVLLDALWHIGKVRPEQVLSPIFGPFWNYRHRARLTVRNVAKKGGVLVGFHEKHSSYVADMETCAILPKKMSDMLVPLRGLVSRLSIADRVPQIELAATPKRTALVFRVLEKPNDADMEQLRAFAKEYDFDLWLQPKGPESAEPDDPSAREALLLEHPEFDVRIAFKPTDFTQVNHAMNTAMVSRAVRLLGAGPEDTVADFFCGLGNFTLALARGARYVTGIEGSDGLVARARLAAEANGLAGKTGFEARNLFTFTLEDWESLQTHPAAVSHVLIDPPREGAEALARVLASTEKRPQRVVYVSCNPATLARDCAILHHEGGWHVRAAGVMNMFPHTGHVESIAVLEPGEKPVEKED